MRILMLDLDTLRPDHLGCYGYHRRTSPNIDHIAAQGIRFENYYCPDAPCLPSRAALFMGRFGIHTGVVNHGGLCADPRPVGARRGFRDGLDQWSLPGLLRQAKLRTVSVSPFGERHSAWWFYAGFSETHNTGRGGGESAEEITPAALDWIRRNAKQDNWFLHVNYWDPHTPYRAPAEFGNPFAGTPLPAWINDEVRERHIGAVGPHTAQEINMWDDKPAAWHGSRHVCAIRSRDDLRRHIDGYDCGIAYMDQHIGRLFDALAEQGIMYDLAVIITSDHGENQGELGLYGEHGTADQITCRIPMIVRWPGARTGAVDTGMHYNLDLPPTLAELLRRKPCDTWDGASYAQSLLSGADCGRSELVLSQCCHVCQRSVRWDDWLYMRTWHDGFHLFPEEMLYSLKDDPHEQNDLAGKRPELRSEGARRYAAWHEQMMRTMPEGYTTDPMDTVLAEGGPFHAKGQLKAYCERLKATDRGWAVEELRKRHPREF